MKTKPITAWCIKSPEGEMKLEELKIKAIQYHNDYQTNYVLHKYGVNKIEYIRQEPYCILLVYYGESKIPRYMLNAQYWGIEFETELEKMSFYNKGYRCVKVEIKELDND